MLKPLDTKLIIDPTKSETRTPSGLYIPDQANKEKHTGIGKIVAVGSKVEELEVGQQVIYEVPHTVTVDFQGTKYHLTKEEFVLAQIEQTQWEEYEEEDDQPLDITGAINADV